jgi:hypothetical protein
VACGDVTSANGEFGRINYSLFTEYVAQQANLTEASIVTGHQQHIYTTLTDDGWSDAKHPELLTHRVSPTAGASLFEISGEGGVNDMLVTIDAPGTYTFEAFEEEELFERIVLDFEEPVSFELITWTRQPYGDRFEKVADSESSVAVVTGTQASFLPVPLNANGDRLLGDLHANLSADPEEAIVPDYTVKPYEQNVIAIPEPLNIYFVLPGDVGITLTDPVSQASSTMNFTVNPLE